MKYKTAVFALIIIIIGFIASFLISKRMYSPIDKITARLLLLEDEKSKNLYSLKQEFLKNIIYGRLTYEQSSLLSNYETLALKLDPGGEYLLLLLIIDSYAEFCEKNDIQDRRLIKSVMVNTSSEHLRLDGNFAYEAVDLNDGYIAVMLNSSHDQRLDMRRKLGLLAGSIQSSVKKYLGISLSVIVSSVGKETKSVGDLYNEVCSLSCYRMFKGYGCTIFPEDIMEKNEYRYSYKEEKILEDMLKLGHYEEAVAAYDKLVQDAIQYSYMSFNMTIMYISIAVKRAIDSLGGNENGSLYLHLNSLLAKLNKIEIISEINRHFYEVFKLITEKSKGRKNLKYEELTDKIYNIINQRYSDSSLSINSIADAVGISPAYLGHLFKDITSKLLVDYISEVRMKKAAELLLSTDLSIERISEQIGYNNSQYFYRVFRKTYNMTPNEYRHSNNKV